MELTGTIWSYYSLVMAQFYPYPTRMEEDQHTEDNSYIKNISLNFIQETV